MENNICQCPTCGHKHPPNFDRVLARLRDEECAIELKASELLADPDFLPTTKDRTQAAVEKAIQIVRKNPQFR